MNVQFQKMNNDNGVKKDEIVFEIDTLNKCNLNCEYCEMQNNSWNPNNDRTDWGQRNPLSVELAHVLNTIHDKHPTRIHLLGGEPTLYRRLPHFINLLNDQKVKIFTNGTTKLHILNELNKKIDLAFSFHIEQVAPNYLTALKFIDNLKLALNHEKVGVVTVNILLHNIHKKQNLGVVKNLLAILENYNRKYPQTKLIIDMFLPFDENGIPRNVKESEKPISELHETFPFLKKHTNSITRKRTELDHYQVDKIETNLENKVIKRQCHKNLWLINYRNEFHFDGGGTILYLKNLHKESLNKPKELQKLFDPKITTCYSKVCSCPANNPYPKTIYLEKE